MPYADIERRREYHKLYAWWQRRKKKLASQTHLDQHPRLYICYGDKGFSIKSPGGRLIFHNGLYLTSEPEEAAAIESHGWYGSRLFRLEIKKTA
jgi:hypothetical protein